ncbi:MAG: hypothetical protein LRZ99_01920 [Desulfotomaculum sp.]|nr:hypothetical protein [Desulfotomaculum sp.]
MELINHKILADLILAVLPVLGGWLVYLVHQLAGYLKAKRQLPKIEIYLAAVEMVVDGAVKSLMPLVEAAKYRNKEGKLTPEQVREFKKEALNRIKLQLSGEAKNLLSKLYNDLEYLLDQRVESCVYPKFCVGKIRHLHLP